MREKDAQTDPQQQVKESIGSGPFIFAKEQWVPGSKAVYLKNKEYVPRPGNEPPSSFAGTSIASVSSSSSRTGSYSKGLSSGSGQALGERLPVDAVLLHLPA